MTVGAAAVERAMTDAVWRCERVLMLHGGPHPCFCWLCEDMLWAQTILRGWREPGVDARELREAIRLLGLAEGRADWADVAREEEGDEA